MSSIIIFSALATYCLIWLFKNKSEIIMDGDARQSTPVGGSHDGDGK